MGLNAFRAALSVLSGRVDVCDLGSVDRRALGITFDPKDSVEVRDRALRLVEQCIEDVVFSGEPNGSSE